MAFKAVANLLGEAVICADEKDRVKYLQIWFRFVQSDIIIQKRHRVKVGGRGGGLHAGAVYRFSLAPFKYNTEGCHLEKYAAWA